MGNCQNAPVYFKNMNLTTNMNPDIQFTRYLYEKDEVKLTLMMCILNRKEESVFWAYELYYSGFINELVELLLKMYYDFYASSNPSFETYLYKKTKILVESEREKGELLSVIINNFMIRHHTCDVFFMRTLAKELTFAIPFIKSYQKTYDFNIINPELKQLLEVEDYLTIARLVFYDIFSDHLHYILEIFVDHFIEKGVPLKKKTILQDYNKKKGIVEFKIEKLMLFSRLIHYASVLKNVKMGKNLYVCIEPEEVVIYETINANLSEKGNGNKSAILPAYKILPLATMYSIDEDNYLSLFRLKREKMDIVEAYQRNWLYHASFSPLWKQRIDEYKGVVNYKTKTVVFQDDDSDGFYENYGFEPDEQKQEIQNKTVNIIVKKRTWYDFYLQNKNRGIIDIDKHYIDTIEKIQY